MNCSGRNGGNIKTNRQKLSRSFEPLYRSVIINYDNLLSRDEEYQTPCYLFIYPSNFPNNQYFNNLINWKHRRGFEVHTANTSETGSNTNSIKNYIQNAYNSWENPPEFVCFLGDASGSFTIPASGSGDHFYTQLEGNDILADICIGRLSFESMLEFETIVDKILNYEKNPYMDNTNWYTNSLLVGDPSSSGQSTIITKKNIKEMMLSSEPDFTFDEVYGGSFTSQMATSFNSGVSYMNYRGYMGMSGWTNSNTGSLSNGYMLPVAVIMTCATGSFTYDTSRSECFLRAGVPGSPKGAIASIGTATTGTHTCFNNCADAGTYYGIFADHIYNMGGALNRGKLNLYLNYPNQSGWVANFSEWNNLMGDPGMELWTNVPQELIVEYDSEVSTGTNFLEITVKDSDNNILENAWVTILKGDDEIFVSDYSDAEGKVYLPLLPEAEGFASLTVTLHNYIPHIGNFTIGQSDVFVNHNEYNIDDDMIGDSSGNNDGLLNPGEDIELGLSLKNYGDQAVNSVTAAISTGSDLVTILDDYEEYGTIEAGNSIYSSDDFDISIHPDALGGSEVALDILITDENRNEWLDRLYLQIDGANISYSSYWIDDNNNLFDPGETVELIVALENLGSVTGNALYGTISSIDNNIVVDDESGYFGDISSGNEASNSSDRFVITANTNIIPGSQFVLEMQLSNSDGYNDMISFMIEVGEVSINDPLGPDAYGYYCYDDEDTDYYNAPVYDWIEIDPDYGGEGTILNMNDGGNTGDIEIVDLPFGFRFYGEEYSQITVCSNGWIAPGITEQYSFMNWHIPGPMGPSPIIAPFWDDLKTASGNICCYFDSGLNYFVVEWSHLQNEFNNDEETFQTILYDPNYYPTSNGDGEIVFQYETINNVDSGQYRTQHGQYATVGIEDHTSFVGLEYTYNNAYPLAAKQLENEMALLFTGPPVPHLEPFIIMGGVDIFDENGNGNIDYDENVDINVLLNNLGENPATGVSATISADDEFIQINNAFSDYNDIQGESSGENLDHFNITVLENCPDQHLVPFEIQITSNENSWLLFFQIILNAPVLDFSGIFIDDGDNNILDPGENADIYLSFQNNGGADAYAVNSEIMTTDTLITLNSTTFDLGDISFGNIATAVYNITVSENAETGNIAIVDWILAADHNLEADGEIQLAISQIPVYLEEGFESFPPTDWHTEGGSNWNHGEGNQAGGTAPEAQFTWTPSTVATQRLVSMPINSIGSSTLELEFKHSINDFSGNGYTLRVETSSDGENWNTVESWQPQQLSATTEHITVNTPDVGSNTFRIAWTFDGDSWDINYWYVDDIIIESGTPQNMGYVTGNVVLIGGEGDIEDVQIEADGFITHPDQNGNYNFPLSPGSYDITAGLANYESVTEYDVDVLPNETVNLDFSLNYMTAPENLEAVVDDNDVELNWIMPELINLNEDTELTGTYYNNSSKSEKNAKVKNVSANRDQTRTMIGYKVYRDNEEIIDLHDVGITSYTDTNLENGEYEYYVTATYDGGESLPSNIAAVTVDFSNIENNEIPNITALFGNYPNPFKSSTSILFSLNSDSANDAEILIYNIKGQMIKAIPVVRSSKSSNGKESIYWDGYDDSGKPVNSGIYFYKLQSDEKYTSVKKMILFK